MESLQNSVFWRLLLILNAVVIFIYASYLSDLFLMSPSTRSPALSDRQLTESLLNAKQSAPYAGQTNGNIENARRGRRGRKRNRKVTITKGWSSVMAARSLLYTGRKHHHKIRAQHERDQPLHNRIARPLLPPAPLSITTNNLSKMSNWDRLRSRINLEKSNEIYSTQDILTRQIYVSGHMNAELNLKKLCPHAGADLKLFILVMSAPSHADARLAIRKTWAFNNIRRNVSLAFVVGRNTDESQNWVLTQENLDYGDLIRGNFIDSYDNLTLKTISGLEWVDEHCPNVKYVLKTDDSIFINVPKLLAFLDNHSEEMRVIYGRVASTDQFSAAEYLTFTTGPAYVISGDVVHELYTNCLNQTYLKLENMFITGIVAESLNIKRVHVEEFQNRRHVLNTHNLSKSITLKMKNMCGSYLVAQMLNVKPLNVPRLFKRRLASITSSLRDGLSVQKIKSNKEKDPCHRKLTATDL